MFGTAEFLTMRPKSNTDARFLLYVTLSRPWLAWAEQTSYGSKMPRTSWAAMAEFTLDWPPLEEQRRIADFLDEQVSLLDRAVELRQRQLDLLEERRSASFSQLLRDVAAIDTHEVDPATRAEGWRLLGHVLRQLTNGYVGPTRDLLVEEGVPYLQSLHIKQGAVDFDRRPYFVPPEWLAARPRITLSVGDLLIVQTGALGEVALVDERFAGASCHALLIARTNDLVRPKYLWHLFRSDWGKHALLRRKTGALHPHLEAGEIRNIRIPVPPVPDQDLVVRQNTRREAEHARIVRCMQRSQELLWERRQALITSAVSGRFDVVAARKVAVA